MLYVWLPREELFNHRHILASCGNNAHKRVYISLSFQSFAKFFSLTEVCYYPEMESFIKVVF